MQEPNLLRDLIADLRDAFPNRPFSPANMRMYESRLRRVPIELLRPAVYALIDTSEFMPSIRAILQECAEQALGLPTEVGALEQIDARVRWAREPERDRGAAPYAHPLVDEAVRHVGGYHAFRTSEEPTVLRGQFGRFYRELRATAIRDAQVGRAELTSGGGS